MKCKICGAESGKYPLCRVCNLKREKGEIIKCSSCGNWHFAHVRCDSSKKEDRAPDADDYLYGPKKYLISQSEQAYYDAIVAAMPSEYHVFPQVNLASFVVKNNDSPFHNELFRNVDFLVTNEKYQPQFVIEINDQTHLNQDRKERDDKVQKICEEAGFPVVKFWTSYGVNTEYIRKKIQETVASLPVPRTHHFNQGKDTVPPASEKPADTKKQGCYVATCVYGSYDCPEVWTLRRFRDTTLASTWYGRAFIKTYYAISPTLVKWFGKTNWFKKMWKGTLDRMVAKLQAQGVESTPYNDQVW